MTKTYKKPKRLGTRKNGNKSSLVSFQKEITVVFLEMIIMVKLFHEFHWKTYSYATHNATDELYSKLNGDMGRFIEILMDKTGVRIDDQSRVSRYQRAGETFEKYIRLIELSSPEALKREIEAFKGYLVSLNNNKAMKSMSNTDLFNIRDTILGDMNQFLYLLTFK